MRIASRLLLSSLAASTLLTLSASSFAEMPQVKMEAPRVEARLEPAYHAPTPKNPDKLPEFRVSKATGPVPHVSEKTLALAKEHDLVAAEPGRPMPETLRLAKHEVVERDSQIKADNSAMIAERVNLERGANRYENPVVGKPDATNSVKIFVPRTATGTELTQAAEGYVSAAQVAGVKRGNYLQRASEGRSDSSEIKPALRDTYRDAARLYGKAAEVMDKARTQLLAEKNFPEAAAARNKAQNMRVVAQKYQAKADAIDAN